MSAPARTRTAVVVPEAAPADAPVAAELPAAGAAPAAGATPAAGAAPAAAPHEARYVYAVVPAGTRLTGLRPGLEVVVAGDLAAVVSPVPALLRDAAGAPPGPPPGGIDGLASAVREHEEVVEELMESAPVVPLRFGTAATSLAAVRQLLERNAASWRRSLERVAGRSEWSVKVWWDGTAPEATETVAAPTADESPGRAYLHERRRQRDRAAATRRELAHLARAVEADLASVTVDRVTTAGGRGDGKLLLLAVVCLVERAFEERFLGELADSLRRHGGGRLTADATGPWPPYHFVAEQGA